MQGKFALDELQNEQEHHTHGRERQNTARIAGPGLFGLRVDPDRPVDESLAAGVRFAGVDPIHVVAQRYMHGHQRHHQ